MALSIEAARQAVLAEVHPLPTEEVAVQDALGRVLAEDVAAAADVPAFDNSAMDGFAVRAGAAGRTLRLVSESRAGAPAAVAVGEGEAIRISTGAAIPDGADGVLELERVATDGEAVGPEGIPPGFRGSRTPPGGDRWASFPVERCGKGH